ncbi:MAG: DUF1015 domain-containing protein, partial [Bacteroidota bacterium]
MAILRPFKGYRPLPQYAARVASRPYDVLSSDEARKEAAGNPLSFLHIGKPEIDLPQEVNPYDERVYVKGKENLMRLIADGVLSQDEYPCLYLYAQTMGTHTQSGIVGCVSVLEYLDGTIKKHELTRPDKEDDRTKHVKVTNAHTGPIFLAYHARPEIDALVDQIRSSKPEYDFVAEDGVGHRLWVIDDEHTTDTIIRQFASVKNLYIADGHHRAAAAARVAKELAVANPNHTGGEEYNYFLAVLFPHNHLKIMDYNRVVKDLNGRSVESFLRSVQEKFQVESSAMRVKPSRKGEFGVYIGKQWCRLTAPASLIDHSDPVERLDVSILQNHLLGPILGINDPRTDKRIDFVGGIRGLDELERRVNSGEMA